MENNINRLIKQNELILNKLDVLENKINSLNKDMKENKIISNEIIYAHIFNNTIFKSEWLNDKTFSPGRWAIGYSELYCLYRVLNEFKPKSLLELGLGQSTKMIGQYVKNNKNIIHCVVESDNNWIEFFKSENELSKNTEILNLEYEMKNYKNVPNVRVYKDFDINFSNKKFDFIFVDAPLCADMPVIGRVDILNIIPNCIEDSFVILVDDCDRVTEQRMIGELQSKLKNANISFKNGIYSGAKDIFIICSEDKAFLTTM